MTQFQAHECKHRAVVYSSGDEISGSECELLNASGLDTISESDFDSSFETTNDFNQAIISPEEKATGNNSSPADSRLIYRVPTETGTPVANSAMSKRQTLAEMKQLVDAMLQKATRYEKRVKRKAKRNEENGDKIRIFGKHRIWGRIRVFVICHGMDRGGKWGRGGQILNFNSQVKF